MPRAVRFKVSRELLATVLGLPQGCTIVGVEPAGMSGDAELTVVSDEFPDVAPGEAIPLLEPVVESDPAKRRWEELRWNWNHPGMT